MDESGAAQKVGSSDVNEYLREISGRELSTKDFRTWAGSVYVASDLMQREMPVRLTDMAAAVSEAAHLLGNTPAVCRKSYVHPRVLDPETWSAARRAALQVSGSSTR